MKIECSCGTKYNFDVTPEMVQSPIQFTCPSCGLDLSDFVNEQIRQEFAPPLPVAQLAPPPSAAAPSAVEITPAGEAAPAGETGSSNTKRLRVTGFKPAAAAADAASPAPAPAAEEFPVCAKHPLQRTTHRCLICRKPICPRCMELFGYVCSPLCRARADSHGIDVPVYENQKAIAEARMWRRVMLIGGAIAAVVAGLLGFWIWFAWFGSKPTPVFSVKFAEPAESGQSAFCVSNQIVFLHGDILWRYDLKTQAKVWASDSLIDKRRVAAEVQREIKAAKELVDYANMHAWEDMPKVPSPEKLTRELEEAAAAALRLHVYGQNIWVASYDKLVRLDWNTGKPAQEVSLADGFGGVVSRGGELVMMTEDVAGQKVIQHISLASGETRLEKIGGLTPPAAVAGAARKPGPGAVVAGGRGQPAAGLPIGVPGKDGGKPLDPAKVAEQAQRLPLAAKIALPALLAGNANQERVLAQLKEGEPSSRPPAAPGAEAAAADSFSFIPSQYGYLQFSVRLLEEKLVARKAMKDPPKKSVLDGNVNITQSLELANEMLNEAQRARGGGEVVEDESRYQVTVRCPDKPDVADWVGEVTGEPALFPLKTVTVIAAGKSLIVLDKANKKLWTSSLTHKVEGGFRDYGGLDQDDEKRGLGPCVERGDALYVFDEAVLTAFDLATGNARWRLPSVGVQAIFFDDKGMMYVNTTTASPDSIKYSRQIDINQRTGSIILKLDPKTGKTLWAVSPGGFISYLSGKYIFLVQAEDADGAEENPYSVGLEPKSHLWIRRLDPGTGRVMWQVYQKRAPLDVQFSGNRIQIVFKKEMQVLRFLTF